MTNNFLNYLKHITKLNLHIFYDVAKTVIKDLQNHLLMGKN